MSNATGNDADYDYYNMDYVDANCSGWRTFRLIHYLIPMIIVTVGLGFFKRRKILWKDILQGRPGVLYPVNFIDEYERRWVYCAVFGAVSKEALDLFFGTMYWTPPVLERYSWLKVFILAINIVILGVIFYPLSACIHLRKYLIANLVGVVTTIFFLVLTFFSLKACSFHDANLKDNALLMQILLVPVYLCYLSLLICFIGDAFLNVRRLYRQHSMTSPKKTKVKSHCIRYMEALMERKTPLKPTSLKESLISRVRYTSIIGLRYSPRVVCTMVVAFFVLYTIATQFGFWVDTYLWKMLKPFRDLEAANEAVNETVGMDIEVIRSMAENLNVVRYSFIFANVFATLVMAAFIVHMMLTYRSNFLQLIRGEHGWHPPLSNSPTSQLLNGMRYSGYQIAYIIYGYFIMLAVVTALLLFFAFLIILPIKNRVSSIVLNFLKGYWPTVLISLAIYLAQYLMARFAFLQERGKYLALNNRRMYHVMSFLLFFFNILLGVFSCLKRVLIGMIFGIVFISRLDTCLLPGQFARFDSGYQAYIGMMMVDVYHNHPLLKAAVEILVERARDASFCASEVTLHSVDGSPHMESGTKHSSENAEHALRRKYIRNRWWKLVTLINNPALVLEMETARIRDQIKNGGDRITLAAFAYANKVHTPDEKQMTPL